MVSASAAEMSLQLYSRRPLLDSRPMSAVQRGLQEFAPLWSRRLRFVEDEAKREYSLPFELRDDGSLLDAITREVSKPPSEFFRALERKYGSVGPRHRHSVTIAGSHDVLVLYLELDSNALWRIGDDWHFGNRLGFGLAPTSVVDGRPLTDWLCGFTAAVAEPCAIDYGYASTAAEYWTKNLSSEGGRRSAMGRDVSRSLPGLYWLNYFGDVYCRLIGRNRLLSAPAYDVKPVGNGILLRVIEQPSQWNRSDAITTYRKVLDHIGGEFFFDRADPQQRTVAPNFGADTVPAASKLGSSGR